jgi:hypothetical protein
MRKFNKNQKNNFNWFKLIALLILNFSNSTVYSQKNSITKTLIEKYILENRPLYFQNFTLNSDTINDKTSSTFISIKNNNENPVELSDRMVYIKEIIINVDEDSAISNFDENKLIVRAIELSHYYKSGEVEENIEFIINITQAFDLCEIDTLPGIFNTNNKNNDLITNLFFNIEFDYKWKTSINKKYLEDNIDVTMLVIAINSSYKYINSFQKRDYDNIFKNQLQSILQNKKYKDTLEKYKYIPIIEIKISDYNIEDSSYVINYFNESDYFYSESKWAKYINKTGFYQTKVILNERDLTLISSLTESFKIHVNEKNARKIEELLGKKSARNILIRFNTERDLTFSLNDKNKMSDCLVYRSDEFGTGGVDNNCIIEYNLISVDLDIDGNLFRIKI